MKLLFIYGPPASGKLTIAEKLSDRTGISLFHNHLSRDLVKDIYPNNLMAHYKLVDQIRFDVFEYCAKNETNLIFTYVYEGKDDDANVMEFIRKIESNNGEVVFVELIADRVDLLDRVDNASRKRFKKLIDKSVLEKLTQSMDIFTIPFVPSIKINTSKLTPEESVDKILSEVKL
jgi:adenylylsulfate kinase-like enzyme